MKKAVCYVLYLLIIFMVGLIVTHDLNLSPSNCVFWIIGMAPIFSFCLGMSYEHFDRKEKK
ncbi:MAG: hypothetical protein MR797_05525 [Lachnospiraceae bacterium]|nr:hypothetical protein [Lachnospiraceae bacterium]